MIELGEKWPKPEAEQPAGAGKEEAHYPYFSISKDVGLDQEDAGKTITATVKLRVKSVEKRVETKNGETKKIDRAEFDVLAIGIDKKDFADAVEEGIKK